MKILRKHASLYIMIIPVFIYFAIFTFYPLARGFLISLQDFRLIGDRPFIGLANYLAVFQDPVFWRVLINTLIIGGGILLIGFIFPIIIAICLNEIINTFLKKFIQTTIYIPHLFSWVIIGGIWIYVLSPNGGIVNELIRLTGNEPIYFFTEEHLARPLMIAIAVWKDMGYNCILYLAAIVGINPNLFEAARIDGANRWQEIRHIMIPQLIPTMKVVFILNLMGVLKIFDQIYVLRNPAINRQIDVLMYYVYDKGILNFEMGEATAASFLVIVITFVCTVIVRRIIRYS